MGGNCPASYDLEDRTLTLQNRNAIKPTGLRSKKKKKKKKSAGRSGQEILFSVFCSVVQRFNTFYVQSKFLANLFYVQFFMNQFFIFYFFIIIKARPVCLNAGSLRAQGDHCNAYSLLLCVFLLCVLLLCGRFQRLKRVHRKRVMLLLHFSSV